ncbi:methyl-accepting chemotaxis protein-1 (serine sensor receptor) [Duganella sp. 1411]|nr:methyl-accepting chemotaxis protein-1 (serine sensor receptor) [Duganella sp. 1411]
MNWNTMRLGVKLPLTITLLVLLMGAAAMLGFSRLNGALDTFRIDVAAAVQHERQLNAINLAFREQIQGWKNTLLRGKDSKALEKYWADFEKSEQLVALGTKQLLDTIGDPKAHEYISKFAAAHALMGRKYREGLEAFKASGFDHTQGDARVAGMDREPVKLLAEASEDFAATATAVANATLVQANKAQVLSYTALAVMSVVGLLLGHLLSRSVIQLLGGEPADAAATAQAIAGGDLSTLVKVRDGDTTSLMVQIKQMQTSLINIVSQVRAGTETIATASAQIASGNLDLSSRTEEQASSLEETASSMEELTATVKHNADNAAHAHELARCASSVASEGGNVMSQMVDTMGSINESSRKIVDIIGVIDSIAFQTNILALNAAVEAARAGEQGRGFAVVAAEVRNLAQRSAAAAKEIKTLIGDSVGKVENGAKLVDLAGATMNEVVASVQRVSAIIGEITNASNEQRTGIEQINEAIGQMDNVTQQNAALVEEAAAAAQSLKHQSDSLSRVVGVFKLADHAGRAAPAGASASKRGKVMGTVGPARRGLSTIAQSGP